MGGEGRGREIEILYILVGMYWVFVFCSRHYVNALHDKLYEISLLVLHYIKKYEVLEVKQFVLGNMASKWQSADLKFVPGLLVHKHLSIGCPNA